MHEYADYGTYAVTLTVDEGTACENSLSLDVLVDVNAEPPSDPLTCEVPNFSGTLKSLAEASWDEAGFTTSVIFRPPAGQDYTIQSQSLVGGPTEVDCASEITVGPNPGGGKP